MVDHQNVFSAVHLHYSLVQLLDFAVIVVNQSLNLRRVPSFSFRKIGVELLDIGPVAGFGLRKICFKLLDLRLVLSFGFSKVFGEFLDL
jgi:hypothetical protein